jgi:hypothetical protein
VVRFAVAGSLAHASGRVNAWVGRLAPHRTIPVLHNSKCMPRSKESVLCASAVQ